MVRVETDRRHHHRRHLHLHHMNKEYRNSNLALVLLRRQHEANSILAFFLKRPFIPSL